MASAFTEERAIWLYKHYLWLERRLPTRGVTARARMVLSTKEFFPERYGGDHASAVVLFRRIRELMGMGHWHCELAQRHSPADEVRQRSGLFGETSSSGAAGTFSVPSENEVLITYSASSLSDPTGLVATLSHELCHYLLASVKEEPPW